MSALTDYIDKDLKSKYSGANAPINCIEADQLLKQVGDELALARQQKKDSYYINELEDIKLYFEKNFTKYSCRDKIERTRLDQSGNIITKYSIEQELDLEAKQNKQQEIYIAVGSLTLLAGLYFLLKKREN